MQPHCYTIITCSLLLRLKAEQCHNTLPFNFLLLLTNYDKLSLNLQLNFFGGHLHLLRG